MFLLLSHATDVRPLPNIVDTLKKYFFFLDVACSEAYANETMAEEACKEGCTVAQREYHSILTVTLLDNRLMHS